jgi:uncharacterized protein YbjT (DUF2867 family)
LILVLGAGGKFGCAALQALVARGADVAGMARSDEAARRIAETGAKVVRGDLRDEASLVAAIQTARVLYHICPNVTEDELEIGDRVLRLARGAEIEHFVLHGVSYPYVPDIAFHWAKAEMEARVAASGLSFSIVRPVQLMQNIEWSLPLILERGVFELPYAPERRISLVDVADVGEAVARVLSDPDVQGGTWELCGTSRAIDRHEMVAGLSAAFGTKITAGQTEMKDLQSQAFFAALTPYQQDHLGRMYDHLDGYGTPYFNNDSLTLLLGRTPTDYVTFAARLAARWGASS